RGVSTGGSGDVHGAAESAAYHDREFTEIPGRHSAGHPQYRAGSGGGGRAFPVSAHRPLPVEMSCQARRRVMWTISAGAAVRRGNQFPAPLLTTSEEPAF